MYEMPKSSENDVALQWVVLGLSFAGILLVYMSTSRYGIGLSPDSAQYISAARSLLSGDGYVCFDSSSFVSWPPLFPTLLAFFGLVGIDPMDGARYVNTFVFGMIIFVSGQLFLRQMQLKYLAIAGTVAVLCSVPLLSVAVIAWTEPLFVLLTILFVMYLPAFLHEKKMSLLVFLSCLAALSFLQRYIGITLVITGFVVLLVFTQNVSFFRKCKYALIFGVLSVMPMSIWILRNFLLTATFTGGRNPSNSTIYQNVMSTFEIGTTWFLSSRIPFEMRMVAVGSIMVILTLITIHMRNRLRSTKANELLYVPSAATFMFTYVFFLSASSSIFSFDRVSERLLSPIYIFAVFLILTGVENVVYLLNHVFKNKRLVHTMVIGICIMWLLYPLSSVLQSGLRSVQNGAGGYSTIAWKESPLMKWMCNNQLDGKVYSNAPDALYVIAGITAYLSPHRSRNSTRIRQSMLLQDKQYIVWFDNKCREYLYSLQELTSLFDLKEVVVFSDGGVYSIR